MTGAIMDEEREMVLRMLKEGKITVEEADALLQELTEQRPEDEGSAAPPPPGQAEIPGVREELRTVFQDLMESMPRDVVRELKHAREAFRPGFFHVIRSLRGLAEGRAATTAEEAMGEGDQVLLSNAWGDVALGVSPDERLRVRAVKRVWAETAEDAQREAEALPVEVRRQEATIEINVPRPVRRHQRSRVDFHLSVPAGVGVRLDVAKGDVEAEGLRGKLDLRIARGDVKIRAQDGPTALDVISGDLQVAAVRGDVRLDVRSGDIAVRDLAGSLRGRIIHGDVAISEAGEVSLDIVHGDVALTQARGDVDIETKSGDVALAGVRAGEARVRTLSGDVEISVEELGEGAAVHVETMSGDITAGLPAAAHATIEASTRTGSVQSRLPLRETSSDRRSVRGVLNEPGATVRLSAVSGDIEIRESR
jgi:DUF4097 and DUF4098 domain-containing protein YvlB/polyhydroxyalkanoate synthesis regulator phasin